MISKRVKQIQTASLWISLSGLISKILAAIYRIPYQNLVGDRGFFAYQQIYPILAIISTLGLLAFPNLIASLAQKKSKSSLKSLFFLELITSFFMTLALFLFSDYLATLMGVAQLSPAIKVTALVCLIMPFLSFYRGLAQARGDMKPTAVSQVLEQSVRISIIILAALAYLLVDLTIYETAIWASLGSLAASLISLLYLMMRSSLSLQSYLTDVHFSWQDIRQLGFPSLVFVLYAIYLLLFQLVDAFFVKNALTNFGLSDQLAEATKGIYDRGQPLIQFGLIFSTAFFTSHLPQLTRLHQQDRSTYQKESQSFHDFIFYINLILTVGMMVSLPQLNAVLFEDNEGYLALLLFLPLIFLSSMIQYFHQRCFIENRNNSSLLFLSLGLLLKLLLTYPLTASLGIIGSSLATVLALAVTLFLYQVTSHISGASMLNGPYYLAVFLMAGMVCFLSGLLPASNRLLQFFNLLISASSGGLFFLLLAKKWAFFPDKLWSYLPFYKEK